MSVVNRLFPWFPLFCLRLRRIAAATLLGGSVAAAPAVQAQDASFGCKVLLCAAATAPGWAGIPYCVPVMQQLFTQLARRGSWPICAEAQAGPIGYDPYLPCPERQTPANDGGAPSSEGQAAGLCVDLSKPQQVCGTGGDTTCRTTYPTVARQLRQDPNFVDLTTAAGTQRFYFSLRGY